jgi:hypothetical protein
VFDRGFGGLGLATGFHDALVAAPPGFDVPRQIEGVRNVRVSGTRRVCLKKGFRGPPLGQRPLVEDPETVLCDTDLDGIARSEVLVDERVQQGLTDRDRWDGISLEAL